MAHLHGTELSPTSRTIVANAREVRWQAGTLTPDEEYAKLAAERREQERMTKIRAYWHAPFEKAEWWRQFNQGWSYTALLMLTVFAFGLLIGYFAHGTTHHG